MLETVADQASESVPQSGDRHRRLAASLSGTNLSRAGDYNQRIVLQTIRMVDVATRGEIVERTGLTAPTIANITKRLLERGLIVDAGRRSGMRGQPAMRFAINPDGGVGIGVNIDRDHVSVVALDLGGEVRGRSTTEICFAMPSDVRRIVRAAVSGFVEAGLIDTANVLGVGIAIPDGLGSVALPNRPDGYDVWNTVDVSRLLAGSLPWRIYVDNDAAAAAMGEAQFGAGRIHKSFFYLLLTAGLGGGLVIDGSYYRGFNGRSGEIGFLPTEGGGTLQDFVSLSALNATLGGGTAGTSPALLTTDDPDRAAAIDRWIESAADRLVMPLVSVNCLLDPESILIGGRLPVPLIEKLATAVNARMRECAADLPSLALVTRAELAADAPAVGAAILPFVDQVFPSDLILMKAEA